jgi:hypothetical protein
MGCSPFQVSNAFCTRTARAALVGAARRAEPPNPIDCWAGSPRPKESMPC